MKKKLNINKVIKKIQIEKQLSPGMNIKIWLKVIIIK